ncbi:RagB/SusD family nutrient uptake outer membrane protein [Sphingobacterium hotanense]|uniref:RagB/SusD family nutrient uptake outer membrane protein n=1 Tax=Sphingobacterium TaxID=28453 RepID=UPI0021A78BEA|nr:RagB/SusD family nutrient uptake outer membrane protein [Sphingobacterium hotanense]MCT1523667.1 RagB/SusD family nutrient uptake outer membrane protein [Sphingobacterium hotanense]
MKKLLLFICLTAILSGCGKDFLDIKRDTNQVVPVKVRDYLAILNRINMLSTSQDLAFVGSDEYYLKSNEDLIALSFYSPYLKNAYTWEDNIFTSDEDFYGWYTAYEKIMYANLALEVEKLSPDPQELEDRNRVRVAARFHRALNFYHLAQQFCEVYDPKTAEDRLGLQLRTDYDVSVHYDRSNLQQVYEMILNDLHEAEDIPLNSADNIYLPGKLATQALLARVYLQMGEFDKALGYAEKVLAKKNTIIDYNSIEGELSDYYGSLFELDGKNNPSIIFFLRCSSPNTLNPSRSIIDTAIMEEFKENDLRKKIYFFKTEDGRTVYTGSYAGDGAYQYFTGLSTEEMLLIRAECNGRSDKKDLAIQDLNLLRSHRFSNYELIPANSKGISDIVDLVLKERRLELFMRGFRWEDARRLNREGRYPISFTRYLEEKLTTLTPKSKKWVWPIPEIEIIRSGIVQNTR